MEGFKKALIVLAFVLTVPSAAEAASLYFSPSSGTFNINQTFQAGVYVSSAGQTVNAYSGTISFPINNLQVVSVSSAGSIVNFWVQQPSFSNTGGRVNFEGVTLSPGYQGAGGRVVTITFRGSSGGIAAVSFTSSSVLAADGFGTNVLRGVSGAEFTIQTVAPAPAPATTTAPEPASAAEGEAEEEKVEEKVEQMPQEETPKPEQIKQVEELGEASLPPFVRFGTIAISYLTIMSTIIVLVVVAVGIIFYAWYRINMWRKKMRTETKEVSQSVLSAFKALREEVEEQIEYLDGKPGLNKDERRVRDKLKEALSVSEEFISKEIKDIEKSLE